MYIACEKSIQKRCDYCSNNYLVYTDNQKKKEDILLQKTLLLRTV